MEKNDILYYYCDIKTLYKILEKKSILLTDMTKSNDADEFHFIFELYRKHLYINHGKKASLPIKLSTEELSKANITVRPMARCFTTKKDDLSMWRAYGDDGKGVCIGFNVEALKKSINNKKIQGKNIELKKIIYINKNDKNVLNELFKNFDDNFFVNNYNSLLEISLFHKNNSFEMEDEVRIGVNVYINKGKINNEFNLDFCADIGFFVRIPIEFSDISEIIIGPKCHSNKKEDILTTLKYFYEDSKEICYEDLVKESKLSYRVKV